VSLVSLRNSCILVTGGTGSIGRALVEELQRHGVREVRVLARRKRTHDAGRSLEGRKIQFVEADIAETDRLTDVVEGVDIIFHLAALKDVTACEADPKTAHRTNVVGAANLLKATSQVPGVRRLIAVSSDKACAPQGVLGITKALMERLVTETAQDRRRSFGSVRLGNVWGASGSVLARWHESAARDGRIDVTDPQMSRFIITQQEAVRLLVALAARPFVGEVVAPRMRAYRLGDLANAFAKERSVAVRIIGPRPGEKIHEDLVSPEEAVAAREEGDLIVIDGRADGPGIDPFTSAQAETLSELELRELVRL